MFSKGLVVRDCCGNIFLAERWFNCNW